MGLLCRLSITEWEVHITAQVLRAPISEMTYTVLSGTLNSTIPYYTTILSLRMDDQAESTRLAGYKARCSG